MQHIALHFEIKFSLTPEKVLAQQQYKFQFESRSPSNNIHFSNHRSKAEGYTMPLILTILISDYTNFYNVRIWTQSGFSWVYKFQISRNLLRDFGKQTYWRNIKAANPWIFELVLILLFEHNDFYFCLSSSFHPSSILSRLQLASSIIFVAILRECSSSPYRSANVKYRIS